MSTIPPRTRYLHLATTGLYEEDEIVEVALLDDEGDPLIDALVRPATVTTWEPAESIHGISPAMVEHAPQFADLLCSLVGHLRGARLVVFGLEFVARFLGPALMRVPAETRCCLEGWRIAADDVRVRGQRAGTRLVDVAAYVGHTWSGPDKRARPAAEAIRAAWLALQRPDVDEYVRESVKRAAAEHAARAEQEQREKLRVAAEREAQAKAYIETIGGIVRELIATNPTFTQALHALYDLNPYTRIDLMREVKRERSRDAKPDNESKDEDGESDDEEEGDDGIPF